MTADDLPVLFSTIDGTEVGAMVDGAGFAKVYYNSTAQFSSNEKIIYGIGQQ